MHGTEQVQHCQCCRRNGMSSHESRAYRVEGYKSAVRSVLVSSDNCSASPSSSPHTHDAGTQGNAAVQWQQCNRDRTMFPSCNHSILSHILQELITCPGECSTFDTHGDHTSRISAVAQRQLYLTDWRYPTHTFSTSCPTQQLSAL